MGEMFDEAVERDARYLMPTFARKQVMFVRGRGMTLTDDDGREYLDFVAGLGSVNLGHSHPAVTEAACRQLQELALVSNWYHSAHRGELAETLVALYGGDAKVFFANSGAEANEGAIKLARKWGKQRRGPECVGVITATNSFHGRTIATLAATGQPSKQETFAPLPPGFSHVPLNDLAALQAAVTESTCAVMLEPVLGEAGVFPCDEEYLRGVERLCAERDVLLVLDEVQTGVYRTGTFLAHQGYRVRPQIVTMAKSLANGLPIGAILAETAVADTFSPGDHGTTFGGAPVVCAAALATLSAHAEEGTGVRAARVGEYLRHGLDRLASKSGGVITDVRSRGLMVGITLAEPIAVRAVEEGLRSGLVLNHVGDRIIRFLPPLVCGEAEIDTLLGILPDLIGA